MVYDLTSLFPDRATAILAERTLLYLTDQKEQFGMGPVSPDSDSLLAYLKHDLLELIEKVDPSIFAGQNINCPYVSARLPAIFNKLVSADLMRKVDNCYLVS